MEERDGTMDGDSLSEEDLIADETPLEIELDEDGDPFLEMTALHWRRGDRRMVEARVIARTAGAEAEVELSTRDLSPTGLSLRGALPAALERGRTRGEPVKMRLFLPAPHGAVEAEAELRWEGKREGEELTGWIFVAVGEKERRAIEAFIGEV